MLGYVSELNSDIWACIGFDRENLNSISAWRGVFTRNKGTQNLVNTFVNKVKNTFASAFAFQPALA